jgi:uncharacterized protein YaaN involved in tellurite resistance
MTEQPIVKPGLSLAVTTPPAAPATEFLGAKAAVPTARKELIAFDMLDGATQKSVLAQAQQDFPTLMANNQALLAFGNNALKPLNDLIDRITKEITPVEIPQLTKYMSDLNTGMRKMRLKYDMSDPKVAKWVHDSVNGVHEFFGRTRTLIDVLLEDARNIYQQLDYVKAQVATKEFQMAKNIQICDVLYAQNEQELINIVVVIASMEKIRDLALQRAGDIQVDPNNPADRTKGEQKRVISEFAQNMNLKVAEFKNRLFIGWATSPQLTNYRTLNLSTAVRLDLLINVTLPSVKFAIEQWELAIQMQQAAQMIQQIDEFSNQVMAAAAAAGAQIGVYVADVTQTPSLDPATITAMAKSIEDQASALATAYQKGIERRRASDAAILDAQRVIANAQKTVSDATLNTALTKAAEAQNYTTDETGKIIALTQGVPTQ